MADTYADAEEPLFLDEAPIARKRPAEDTSDTDALLAFEEERPRPVRADSSPGSILFAHSRAPQPPIGVPMRAVLIVAGVALGFAFVLSLIG